MEDELFRQKQNNINLDQKYKDKIESLKKKNNELKQENNKLKEKLEKTKLNKGKETYHKNLVKNLFNYDKYYNNSSSNKNLNINESSTIRNKKNIKDLTDVDSHINRTMFNMNFHPNKPFTGARYLNKNNYFKDYYLTQPNFKNNTMSSFFVNKNKKRLSDANNRSDISENNQNKQKNMINEFKTLLNKIDEKLEIGKK